MRTPLCDQLGMTLPLFAFTRSPEVVVAVSRAGGMCSIQPTYWRTCGRSERGGVRNAISHRPIGDTCETIRVGSLLRMK